MINNFAHFLVTTYLHFAKNREPVKDPFYLSYTSSYVLSIWKKQHYKVSFIKMEEHVKLLFTSTDKFFVSRAENVYFKYIVSIFQDISLCLLEYVIVMSWTIRIHFIIAYTKKIEEIFSSIMLLFHSFQNMKWGCI